MLGRLLPTLLAFWLLLSPAAYADDTPASAEGTLTNTVIAQIDSDVIVTLDGQALGGSSVHRGEDGELYVDALPIFETLQNEVRFDDAANALIVRRSQDGVVMELYTDTGIVKADGKALGKLADFGSVDADSYLLSPNAVAVLSGAAGKLDKENNRLDFKLDPRLRVTTGFELVVNGAPIGPIQPQPKSVGPILLLPLVPIAQALGHEVDVIDGGAAVRVQRNQDSAVFTLNLDTGLVSLFGNPIGLSDDVTLIDPVNLLLPVSAFETLTGTRVSAGEGGTIEITTDDRLTDAVAPDGSIRDIASDTPLTVEYAAFELGPSRLNTVEVGLHGGAISGRLRAEIGDLPGGLRELEPDWLSFDYEHLNGTTGSVGDNYARFRELSGVGASRYRGVSAARHTETGRWSLAAGTPSIGTRAITDRQTRHDFRGLVAGARYADNDGWEAGLAARRDTLTGDQRAVLSAISGRLGRKGDKRVGWDVSASIGAFDGPTRTRPIDATLRAQARYEVNDKLTVDGFADYSGTEFNRSVLADEKARTPVVLEEAATADFVPDIRRETLDLGGLGVSANFRTTGEFGPFRDLSAAARIDHDRTGVFAGGADASQTNVFSVTATTQVPDAKLSLSAGATAFTSSLGADEGDSSGSRVFLGAYGNYGDYSVRTRASVERRDGEASQFRGTVSVARERIALALPKNAGLSLSPNVNATVVGSDWRMRGGLTANMTSGDWFGEKTRVDASVGLLSSVSGRQGARAQQYVSLSVARDMRIGRNMSVGLGYRGTMDGQHRLGLVLRGRYDFNAPRRLRATKTDKGLLQGVAFLDENNDGIRQDGERGAGGIVIRIQGTPFALRTDASGAYTVQNLQRGLYELSVDGRSLPLGYALDPDARTRVSVKDGQVTSTVLPIQRRGQIRGSVYVDANGSNSLDPGEARPDGLTVDLFADGEDEPFATTGTTAFGQFAFDDLPLSDYRISVRSSDRLAVDGVSGYAVSLSDAPDGQIKVRVPVASRERSLSVEARPGAPHDREGVGETTLIGLPP